MSGEWLTMCRQVVDRMGVIRDVEAKLIRRGRAAELLGISVRHYYTNSRVVYCVTLLPL